ncbi:GNAT family N-acetyltransferase [Streptomyces sporangiiformans]|uniref:Lysine N-acyltransferase MbtK n=1 Tax=Streptomyces sporangiiformans TaxID=2315329 RepID=A0A505DC21_9ACTN|nr:GNAT family N-acetyltransferase [Streptomyces sporangiiformans]TPQ20407.1 acetyltransferase [Streptomyces sporangiiformans]
MPPTDASADAGTAPITPLGSGSGPGTDSEETLDLRLPDELVALFAEEAEAARAAGAARPAGGVAARGDEAGTAQPSGDGTAKPSGDGTAKPSEAGTAKPPTVTPAGDDLLGHVGAWGPIATPVGEFRLAPVCVERDLPLISRWMNDPAVAAFWELAGPESVAEGHLRAQLDGDGRSVPCLGVLDDMPMSYWEIYRADLDPLARHYPARPHDTGIHFLIGGVANRGRGIGSTLLRAVSDLVLDRRTSCARVIAEPDLRNTPSVSAFLSAGFRYAAEVDLPGKRAALMVRDRTLRDLL